jgi:arylsulfatase A-like enzyme
MGTILRDAGYVTGHFGKWHLGLEPYSPLEHGFSVDLPHWPGPGPAGSFVAPWKYPAFKEKSPKEHIEDRMADEAVAFLEDHRDQPFFLNYWMFSVHAPFDAKSDYISEASGRINPTDAQRSPTYAGMIRSFDDAIGKLIDTLDRLKLTENTLIIFTSDNGGNMYNTIDNTTPTSNRPLRGGKATMFEGGIRVPWVVSCPSVIPAKSTNNALVQSTDLLSTVLDVLHIKPPTNLTSDGISIMPALKGQALARDAIFTFFPHAPGVPDWLPPSVCIHSGDWKLIRLFHNGDNGAHQYLLYNLANDLGEKQNLAAQEPDRVRDLDAKIEQFLKDTNAVVPTANPKFDPTKYRPELVGVQTVKDSKAK